MSLINLTTALKYARQGNFAVGAFNITNEEMFYGVLDAAIAEKSPIIIAFAAGHMQYIRLESMMDLVRREISKAPVPVVIHLDHCTSFELIMKAIQLGFTSVMYDGSSLSLEENIQNTRRVVDLAHVLNISVEGELGHVGGDAGESGVPAPKDARFTDPAQVPDYIRRTGVDALAVSFGTAHGLYKEEPKLDYDLLVKLDAASRVPLVMHGGSGLPDRDFTTAIYYGIRKINFFTGLARDATESIRSRLEDESFVFYPELDQHVHDAIFKTVSHYLKLWGSSGKAWLQ